jgi:hypothetical protein
MSKHMLPIAITDYDGDQIYLRDATPNEENEQTLAFLATIPANDAPTCEVALAEASIDRLIKWLKRQKAHKTA